MPGQAAQRGPQYPVPQLLGDGLDVADAEFVRLGEPLTDAVALAVRLPLGVTGEGVGDPVHAGVEDQLGVTLGVTLLDAVTDCVTLRVTDEDGVMLGVTDADGTM
jgi:hypothetical protein